MFTLSYCPTLSFTVVCANLRSRSGSSILMSLYFSPEAGQLIHIVSDPSTVLYIIEDSSLLDLDVQQ